MAASPLPVNFDTDHQASMFGHLAEQWGILPEALVKKLAVEFLRDSVRRWREERPGEACPFA